MNLWECMCPQHYSEKKKCQLAAPDGSHLLKMKTATRQPSNRSLNLRVLAAKEVSGRPQATWNSLPLSLSLGWE